MQVLQIRLNGKEQDHEQVLQHQHAERNAAGQRVQFALVVEHLDDDHGAAQRRADTEIERVPPAASHRHADSQKKPDAQ